MTKWTFFALAPWLAVAAAAQEPAQAGAEKVAFEKRIYPFEGEITAERLNVRMFPRNDGQSIISSVLTAGDLSLDPAAHTVKRGDEAISLTPREFALLELFMRHPDEVLSKTEILAHVWDAYYEGDPNVVEVYVGYLRRKIDAPFGRNALQTVRGAGYRLVADG